MLFLLAHLAYAETLYATVAADATRWPDNTLVTLELKKGDVVEVVVREGGKVRVRRGLLFGWLGEELLTATPPEAEGGWGDTPVLPTSFPLPTTSG